MFNPEWTLDGISTDERFQIVDELVSRNGDLNISMLCKYADISRSGYYTWKKRQRNLEINSKELQDRHDFELILNIYNHRGYDKGSRSIHMQLKMKGIIMNRKKVQRLMRKYGLFCPIRKPNPYKKMLKAIETSTIADNLVNREFTKYGPRYILLTDITYLSYGKGLKAYLSSIKDAFTKEILALVVSVTLEEDFVLETIEILMKNHKNELNTDALVHSDQGVHYKAYSFQNLLKDKNIRQSMSRKANCWDNAPQESFHGHMKDEIDLSKCNNIDDVKRVISDYMDYYNNERCQWSLAKLPPALYYKYVQTDIYPFNTSNNH